MEKPSLDTAKAGAIRFNTDLSQLEIYDGNQWTGILATSTVQQTGGTRGFRMAGNTPSKTDRIDRFNVDVPGEATDVGNLTQSLGATGQGFASRTRAFRGGGYNHSLGGYLNNIDFWTITSDGNAIDFGDMLAAKQAVGALSNSTRGVISSGSDASNAINVIQFVTMSSTGNALDFGDLTQARKSRCVASPTRGLMMGGNLNPSTIYNTMDFITTATTGDSADFGDLISTQTNNTACSNAVRGISAGGDSPSTNRIEFVTIATLGNSLDFGDLTRTDAASAGAAASPTRATVFGSGSPVSSVIEYFQLMTLGNAKDFGDLTQSVKEVAGCSNGHGGL